MMAPLASAKRSSISVKTKLEILEKLDRKVLSKSEIAKTYNIPRSTLSTIIKHRSKLRNAVTASDAAGNKTHLKDSKFPELEKTLLEWLKQIRSQNIPVDGNIFKSKAEDFSLRLGIDNFKCSAGWFHRFKARHDLSFKKICGEGASVDSSAVNKWKETSLRKLLTEYKPADVFNADETALFFKLLPDKSLVFKGEPCNGGKRAKQRITVLLAANMDGTEKLKPLVIGRFKKPRCFKGIKTLPLKYEANRKAWMTADIFRAWVKELDRDMVRKQRKILLIVDNCTAHEKIKDLQAVHLEFLPPNATAMIQPLYQGIIQSAKKKYRRMLLRRVVLNLDSGKEYDVTLLSAIHLLLAAWNEVEQSTIVNCFRHAGFSSCLTAVPTQDVDVAESVPDDDDLLRDFTERLTVPSERSFNSFEDYVNIDRDIDCSDSRSDEDIISIVKSSDAIDDESCSSDDEPVVPRPTTKAVLDAVHVLRSYYEGLEQSERFSSMLLDIEKDVSLSTRYSQTSIRNFLSKN